MKKNNSAVFSLEENGMAKLVLEVQNRNTDISSDDRLVKQEENEDTPKVGLKATNATLHNILFIVICLVNSFLNIKSYNPSMYIA